MAKRLFPQIGQYVRLRVPENMMGEAFARGRISSIESYEDYHGKRTWIYVRWFCADGRPDDGDKKHAGDELWQVTPGGI